LEIFIGFNSPKEALICEVKWYKAKSCISLYIQTTLCYISLDYLGCFKDDAEHPTFRYIPGDLDPSDVTPLSCLHACSTRYQYAAIAGKSVCFCGNVINSSMKVDDGLCLDNCTHWNRSCGHVTYYDVFWREQGISGLILILEKRVELFLRTWLRANVLSLSEVEFR
jgi:hypothetical protein